MKCTFCAFEFPDGSAFCPNCGNMMPSEPVAEPVATEPKPKKSKKKLLIFLGIGSTLLIAGIVVLCILLSFSGPAADVAMGVMNLLDEGSFTVDFEGSEDNWEFSGHLEAEVDLEERELTAVYTYMEDDRNETSYIYKGYYIYQKYDYREVYDDYGYYSGYERIPDGYRAYDISEGLDLIFDTYEQLDEGASLDEAVRSFLDSINHDELYDEIDKYVDIEVMEECLIAFCEALNDEDWLEENAGFCMEEEDGMDLYCLEPDIWDFTLTGAEFFEEGFRKDYYDEIMDVVEDEAKRYMKDMEIEVALGIEDDLLVYGRMEGEFFDDKVELEGYITNIGETEIDEDELDSILREADKR